MELIIILIVINIKEIGLMIFNKEWAPIIIRMEIYIKDSGKMENPMDKEIISIKVAKLSIKETGKMEKNKDSVNWSYKIIMDIQVNGKIIKSKEKDHIFTQMAKNMMVNGSEIKSLI